MTSSGIRRIISSIRSEKLDSNSVFYDLLSINADQSEFIPELLTLLGHESAGSRVLACIALKQMGNIVVPPLMEKLDSSASIRVKKSAIGILGAFVATDPEVKGFLQEYSRRCEKDIRAAVEAVLCPSKSSSVVMRPPEPEGGDKVEGAGNGPTDDRR